VTSTSSDPVDLEAMTKDQLLAYAQDLGVPASAAMTKTQIVDAINTATGDVGVNPQTTTTMTKDFLARQLVNPTPGTSNATDFLGRSVLAANKDYLGRALVA